MAAQAVRPGRFWRYNYQVLAGAGYWVLAVPVAASQIVTLWMMALNNSFEQLPATRIAELMTPILGAFLVAHSLAPEYRSGVGAILACKPISLNRVLAMRAGLGMLGAFLLSLVTVGVCSAGIRHVEILPPLAACLPSLLFLSSLALIFATIFRSPLGGFAVAFGLWALDLVLGFSAHPLLSAQGLAALLDADPLAAFWLTGKLVQVGLGVVLWWIHPRLLSRMSRPPERTEVLKIAGACAAIAAIYCGTGAATVVGYAYAHRANLAQRDVIWLQRQLRVYGPVPVAQLFGPAFVVYVSQPPVSTRAGSPAAARQTQLERALARWPNSIWADGPAFALAVEQEGIDRTLSIPRYMAVADRFAASPFAPKALVAIVRLDKPPAKDDERLLAARRLVADYPRTREAESGAEVLSHYYPAKVKADELLAATPVAEAVAPRERKPDWMLRRAELQVVLGQTSQALDTARQAQNEAQRLSDLALSGPELEIKTLRPHRGRLGSTATKAKELIARLQQGQ